MSYLGLVSEANETELSPDARWFDWYDYFPWEDLRDGRRDWIARVILPRLDVRRGHGRPNVCVRCSAGRCSRRTG